MDPKKTNVINTSIVDHGECTRLNWGAVGLHTYRYMRWRSGEEAEAIETKQGKCGANRRKARQSDYLSTKVRMEKEVRMYLLATQGTE